MLQHTFLLSQLMQLVVVTPYVINICIYKVTQKRELLKCVVAAMCSWQHCGTLSYRQPRHLIIMDQWNGQQRAVAIKMFCMFGFLQSSLFFCVTLYHSAYFSNCEKLVVPTIFLTRITSQKVATVLNLYFDIKSGRETSHCWRYRRGCDNIKKRCESVDWIQLRQDGV
jgi:hypothetical protein